LKAICLLFICLLLGACSGDSSSPAPESPVVPIPLATVEYHKAMYPDVPEQVSFADVLALTFEVPASRIDYGQDSLQYAEYWAPTAREGRENLPAIVILHGGCWSNRYRIDQTYSIATAFSQNGFPVWSVEYRASGDPGGSWPGTYNDIEAALSTIDEQRKTRFNNRPLVVIGHSAGGHLALLASSNLTFDFDVIGLAAIVDITNYANGIGVCSATAQSFMNGPPSAIPELYALATPNLTTLSGAANLYIGGQDNVVPTSQAINSGLTTTNSTLAGHFDWIHPGTNTFSILLLELLN
jgi:acetyl esterase/lipase